MREKVVRLRAFLQEVLQEVRRVSWPLPKEITGATLVVILAGTLVCLVLLVYDSLIGTIVNKLIYR